MQTERMDLVWMDLSGADLRGVNLRDADLQGADLHGTSLNKPHLIETKLGSVKLRSTSPVRANLSREGLDGAEFLVDLTRIFLRISMMTNTKLLKVNLTNYGHSGANLSSSDFQVANLTGAALADAILAVANLRKTKVSKTQLADVKSLSEAVWPNGSMRD